MKKGGEPLYLTEAAKGDTFNGQIATAKGPQNAGYKSTLNQLDADSVGSKVGVMKNGKSQ